MNAPFSKRIKEAGLPTKFRMPFEKYSRTKDPISHLESFVHQMKVQNAIQSAMCRMFPLTLIHSAKTWFRKLPPSSVDSFSKLTTAFCAQFQGIKPSPKDLILLQYVTQERGETLRSYMEKFHKEVDIEKQLQIKVEHDEAQLALRPRKETPKPVPVKRFQNQPPNRLTNRPPPISSYKERYPTKRSPLRRSPPNVAPLKEVARVAREEDVYNHYTLSMLQEKPSTSPSGTKAYSRSQDSIKEGKRVQSRIQETANRMRDGEKDLMQQIQVILTISKGPTLAGTSNNSRKNQARKIPRLSAVHEIFKIANCRAHRVLINIGSSVDILFKGVHGQLNLKNSCYNSCTSLLYGFTGNSIMTMGSKILPVIVGEAPLQQNVMTEFIVVDSPFAYNAILGRPFLSGIRGYYPSIITS
ncbi:hypothetical protein LWI28_008001 [Acer negundo]|uniref:Retrotransposon gag domain-containing protein n=1 Tax=Acer negundo TaxID=4023 RepID=A0AAD5NEG2_ACENE|nr:hypothetical protein LWI28_008001 [Acer negundo]